MLEREVENRFRADAVDELIKATDVRPASLLVEMRTRDLINAFIRQLDANGIDPAGVPQGGRDQRRRPRSSGSAPRRRSRSARELVLEGVANKLDIQVSDDEIRADLKDEGESEEDIDEFMAAGGADRVRPDLRLRRAVDRIAAEVTPISQELASARESIWTPGKEEGAETEKKLWTPAARVE